VVQVAGTAVNVELEDRGDGYFLVRVRDPEQNEVGRLLVKPRSGQGPS